MWTRMNLARFFCCLFVTVVGMTIASGESEPRATLTQSQESTSSDIERRINLARNYFIIFGKARNGRRSDSAPMMELNATWETLKMIRDAQRQKEQQKQENIGQNKEQILLHDFPNSNADEYASYDATRSGSLPDVIDRYYNDVE